MTRLGSFQPLGAFVSGWYDFIKKPMHLSDAYDTGHFQGRLAPSGVGRHESF